MFFSPPHWCKFVYFWGGPRPPNAEFGPRNGALGPAIIEGCQSLKWSGLIRWINNPVQSLELTDFAGFVT